MIDTSELLHRMMMIQLTIESNLKSLNKWSNDLESNKHTIAFHVNHYKKRLKICQKRIILLNYGLRKHFIQQNDLIHYQTGSHTSE